MAITQPTTQIDATSGLIAYVQAIKPYHSKILDVLVEYVVQDDVNVTVLEDVDLQIELRNVEGDVIYTCGYGFVWNPYSGTAVGDLPSASIVSIAGDPVNQFVVSMPAQPQRSVVVSSVKANQLTFVTPYNIVTTSPTSQQWVVSGNVTSLAPNGSVFYISSNSTAANGKYTVASSSYNSGTNRTTVTTVEPISLLAVNSGKFNIPLEPDDVPYIPPGAAIKFSTTGQMPAPLDNTTTYYYSPSKKYGVFNLSKVRYPEDYTDLVDVTDNGVGELTMQRSEPFVPGEYLTVTGTADNNGQYAVKEIEQSGSNFIITVYQRVPMDQASAGGTIQYQGSYGDPYCAVAHSPPLHSETYIYERLQFDFGPLPSNPTIDPPQYDVDFI